MSHTLYFCATSFCRSLHELESKVKTCFKVRLPKKLLAQSGGTNSTIIFTNVLNESYSTLITDSLESTGVEDRLGLEGLRLNKSSQ